MGIFTEDLSALEHQKVLDKVTKAEIALKDIIHLIGIEESRERDE